MPEIDIVLVEPLYDGNVGFAARVMKNFGFTRLVLINPCKLGEEAKGRASHAQDVLKAADVCTIEDVFARSNIVIAVLLRRVLGRCNLTTREMSTLHGLLRRSEWHIDPSLLDRDKTGKGNLKEFREDEEKR